MNQYIEINSQKCNGKPVLKDTRIPVVVILDQLAESGSIERLLEKYPELNYQQIRGVLEYCHSMIDHTEFEVENV